MQTPFHLTDKTILITGASSGIGSHTAIRCAEMGASVILTGRNKERLDTTYQVLTGKGHNVAICDLTDEIATTAFVKNLPMLDGIVHCAGIVKPFPIQFISAQKIDETFHANFYTAAGLTSSTFKAKKIRECASIVFLSSISAQFPGKGNALYAASKAALEAYSKTISAEYAHKKIRANCISPAMVRTPMYDHSSEGEFKTAMDNHVSNYPLGVGMPEDVANTIIFLLSSASRWITGTNILMDGGFVFSQ